MRKGHALAIIALLLLTAIPTEAKFKWGIRGGYNIVSMTFSEDVIAAENKRGFYAGMTFKVDLPHDVDLDFAPTYDQRNSAINWQSIRQQAVTLPLNVRKGFGWGDKFSVFIYAGPQFSIGIDGLKCDTDIMNLKRSDFSANVGIGLMMFRNVELKANYNYFICKTSDATFDRLTHGIEDALCDIITKHMRPNAWQIGISFYFN